MKKGLAVAQLETLVKFYCDWAEREERRILRRGTPLDRRQAADARKIGVKRPESVRLLETEAMPSPEHRLFLRVVERRRLIPPETEALTLGYGIYVNSAYRGDRAILAHELKHVAQEERLGGLRNFYRKYLEECFTAGYPNGPMEREALRVEEEYRPRRIR